jgi:hypothetical protein
VVEETEPPPAQLPHEDLDIDQLPYEDLDIEIDGRSVGFQYGGRHYSGEPVFDDEVLGSLELARSEGTPEEYGSRLRKAAFPRGVWKGFEAVIGARYEHRTRLRLLIDGREPELHALRWECLFDERPPGRRLATWAATPLSRAATSASLALVPAVEQLNALSVVCSPADLGEGPWESFPPFDQDREIADLEDALAGLGDRAQSTTLRNPTLSELRRTMERRPFHVLQLVAHTGWQDGQGFVVLFADEEGATDPVDEKVLSEVLKRMNKNGLLMLMLKSSESAGQFIHDGGRPAAIRLSHSSLLPAVVGFHDPLPPSTSRLFLKAFYGALVRPSTYGMVDVAANEARDQVHHAAPPTAGPWDWTSPTVLLRSTGTLFRREGSPQPPDIERLMRRIDPSGGS